MSEDQAAKAPPSTTAAKVAGHIGLWTSVAILVICVVLFFTGISRSGGEAEPGRIAPGALMLQGLLFALVAALGIWLFRDFLKLPDWTLAHKVPLGLKLLGHLGRVLGSLAAAACIVLTVLAVVFPDDVPPVRRRATSSESGEDALKALKGETDEAEKSEDQSEAATGLGKPRPGLAALYVMGIFVSLLVRLFGSAISELRTWVRVGSLVASGAAVALLMVALILSFTQSWDKSAQLALALFAGGSLALFVFLLVYFMLPGVVAAFETRRL